jgi:hypothetical protein
MLTPDNIRAGLYVVLGLAAVWVVFTESGREFIWEIIKFLAFPIGGAIIVSKLAEQPNVPEWLAHLGLPIGAVAGLAVAVWLSRR